VKDTTRFASGLESGAVSPRSALRVRGAATATEDISAVDRLAPLASLVTVRFVYDWTVRGLFDRLRGRRSASEDTLVKSSVSPLDVRRSKYRPLMMESPRVTAVTNAELRVDCVIVVPRLELPSVSPLVALIDCAVVSASPNIGLSRIDSRLPPVIRFKASVDCVIAVPRLELPSVSPLVALKDCAIVSASPNIGLSRIDSRLPPVMRLEASVDCVIVVPRLELPSVSPLVARIECAVVLASPNIGLSKIDSRWPPAMGFGTRDPSVGATIREKTRS
jgi:hypothetical protein